MKAKITLGNEQFEKEVHLREFSFVSHVEPVYALYYSGGREYPLYLSLCGLLLVCKEGDVEYGGTSVFYGTEPFGVRYSVRKGIELFYFDPGVEVKKPLKLKHLGIKKNSEFPGIKFYFEDVVELLSRLKVFFQKNRPEWFLEFHRLSLSFYFHSSGLSFLYGRYQLDMSLEECNRVYHWSSFREKKPLELSSFSVGALTEKGFQNLLVLKSGEVFDSAEFYSLFLGACRLRSTYG